MNTPQDEELQPRFVGFLIFPQIGHQDVKAEGGKFQRDEYGEQVLRRSHEHHAQGRHHDQDIIFASKKLERFDVVDRSQQDQRRCDQDENLEEDRNPIQDKRVL